MAVNEFEQIENILSKSKLVNPNTLLVDEEFKNRLRNDLYTNYINNKLKGGSIMKRFTFALTGMLVVLLSIGFTYLITRQPVNTTEKKETLLSADLAFIEGQVEIKRNNSTSWEAAVAGTTLKQGDTIKTVENAKAIVNIDNGSAVRLSAATEIKLENMNPETIVVAQAYGQTYNRVEKSDTSTFTVIGQEVEAKALGTAYEFNSDQNNGVVTVSTFESKVQVKAITQEKEVNELNKAVISKTSNTFEVKEMAEEEYKSNFAEWNKSKDIESGFEVNEKNAPVVTLTAPASGTSTEASKITITGNVTDDSQLRKIIINGKIYTSMDASGKGFNPADGSFNIDVTLKEGDNTIEVKAYDIYWNASAPAKTTVTMKTNKPVTETESFYISKIYSPAPGKIYVKWVVNGIETPGGFKVVRDTSANPVYPGDDYQYLSKESTREVTWTGVSAGTYYVRVCVYNGAGKCLRYTANKTVKVAGETKGISETTDYADSVSLSAQAIGGGKVKLTWSIAGGEAPNGFKIAWASYPNPGYGGGESNEGWDYKSDPNIRTATISGLTAGSTLHFRVGVYLGGSCAPYSNDVAVNVL